MRCVVEPAARSQCCASPFWRRFRSLRPAAAPTLTASNTICSARKTQAPPARSPARSPQQHPAIQSAPLPPPNAIGGRDVGSVSQPRVGDVTGSAAATARRQAAAGTGRAAPPSRCAGRHHRRPGDALRRAGRRDREANNIPNGAAAKARPAAGHSEVRGDRHRRRARRVARAAHAGAGDRARRPPRSSQLCMSWRPAKP